MELWIEPIYRNLFTEGSTATGDGDVVYLDGKYATAIVQVASTGVQAFRGSVDGDNYVNLACLNLTSGVGYLTSTASGIFSVSVLGMKRFKVNITTASSSGAYINAMVVPVMNTQIVVT